MAKFKLAVNGTKHEVDCDPATPLLFVLRTKLKLTGTKLGCGLEQCGTCAVLVDDEPVLTCARAVSEFIGKNIITVEGLSDGRQPSAVQRAFIAESAAQCGYCTSGLVVATTALLKRNTRPSRADINEALTGHLCRCGSHARVLKAIDRLAAEGRSHDG